MTPSNLVRIAFVLVGLENKYSEEYIVWFPAIQNGCTCLTQYLLHMPSHTCSCQILMLLRLITPMDFYTHPSCCVLQILLKAYSLVRPPLKKTKPKQKTKQTKNHLGQNQRLCFFMQRFSILVNHPLLMVPSLAKLQQSLNGAGRRQTHRHKHPHQQM